MNALFPIPPAEALQHGAPSDFPARPEPEKTLALLQRLSAAYLAAFLALLALTVAAGAWPFAAELRAGGLAGLALGALLLPLTGLLAILPLARLHAQRVDFSNDIRPNYLRRLRTKHATPLTPSQRLARLARRPQATIVPLLTLGAGLLAWSLRPGAPLPAANTALIGGVAIVLAFPLLVAERIVAAIRPERLPEAASLQALLFIPVILIPLGGGLEAASGAGMAWARPAMTALDLFVCLVAAELGIRALANWFLPPPTPADARAAVASFTALLLQPRRIAPAGVAAPLRTHLGLDFSRSWALRYVRAAFPAVTLLIALIGWAVSGVTLLNLDRRGVYERFGAPVAVWQPGGHIGLPWPLGRVRPVELGVIHSVTLAGPALATNLTGAEDPAPASADRLWDAIHPAEVAYLIASVETSGRQSFQSVSVDLTVLYRVGLDDRSALQSAYAVTDPAALVRSVAGQLLARFFAGQVLTDVLGEGRETLAHGLRTAMQAELDRLGAGLDLAAVVIEAIHPPAAAAEAYQNVQAAEIIANTAIATERGRAQAAASMAGQIGTGLTHTATGAAAETLGQAAVLSQNFNADQQAASAGGKAFLLERYFTNLSAALARAPLVIVDHRLGGAAAPTIDLRTFGAPPGNTGEDE